MNGIPTRRGGVSQGTTPSASLRKKSMTKKLLLATLALALLLVPTSAAFAANAYTTSAAYTPGKGTKAKPAPVGVSLAYSVKDTAGMRPQGLESQRIDLAGIKTNGARFKSCSAAKIIAAQNDSGCASGSLVATGYAKNIAGSRTNFADGSIRCYLSLRLHNAGAGKLALFVKGDPTLAGDKNCPIAVATAIPISVTKTSTGSSIKFVIPESLKHPLATITNSLTEMSLKVSKKTTKVNGKTVGLFEATGPCSAAKRGVTYTFNNEGGSVVKQAAALRC
jgi:hypothetical protein